MKRLILLFMLFSLFGFSQNKKPTLSVEEFYHQYQLFPDSGNTPFLYYSIYDWINTKYKYAGKSKKGIDCSGFVSKMYNDVYCHELSGGSKNLWQVVQPVEKSELKEGDILFFKIKKGQISHVGIYLGNNKFAHASVKSGVIISDLDEEYYKKYFFKGGRVELLNAF